MKCSFTAEKSYNKTDIDSNFGRQKDLSSLKNDIPFLGWINPHVYLSGKKSEKDAYLRRYRHFVKKRF